MINLPMQQEHLLNVGNVIIYLQYVCRVVFCARLRKEKKEKFRYDFLNYAQDSEQPQKNLVVSEKYQRKQKTA